MQWTNADKSMPGSHGEDQSPDRRLRLVGESESSARSGPSKHLRQSARTATNGGIQHQADPRWVLALRTAESLQGTILPPQRRSSLIRMGEVFGLTAFDANMIIALVQDQARRGHQPDQCPGACMDQLGQISHPDQRRAQRSRIRGSRAWKVTWWCVGLLAGELLVIYLLM